MPTAQATQNIKPRISVKAYANEWGVSPMTVYRLIAAGKLEAQKIGNQWRLDPSAQAK